MDACGGEATLSKTVLSLLFIDRKRKEIATLGAVLLKSKQEATKVFPVKWQKSLLGLTIALRLCCRENFMTVLHFFVMH